MPENDEPAPLPPTPSWGLILQGVAILGILVPLGLVFLFRHRIRPSISVRLEASDSEKSEVHVRNASAGNVGLFDVDLRVYESETGERVQLGRATSDLPTGDECVIPVVTKARSVIVALTGRYYLFPKVRFGAVAYRRDFPVTA